MNRYEQNVIEITNRIEELRGRVIRFAAHATLHTRVDGVKAELARLEATLPKARATAKWAKELYKL